MKKPKGAMVQKGAIGGAMHPRCKGAISYMGIAPFVAPPHQPEVQPQSTRELVEEVLAVLIRDIERLNPEQ